MGKNRREDHLSTAVRIILIQDKGLFLGAPQIGPESFALCVPLGSLFRA
jgi:hypothetical protein